VAETTTALSTGDVESSRLSSDMDISDEDASVVPPEVTESTSIPGYDFESLGTPPSLAYHDFSNQIHSRPLIQNSNPMHDELFKRIVTPYNADAFELALTEHKLTDAYPLLVHNLRHSFPIGDLPILTHTHIIPNHASCKEHPNVVKVYIQEELDVGRFSGPYTRGEMESIMRGPFKSSPLIVAESDQGPDLPPKFRICRHLSKEDSGMPSVNSYINKEDFPTRFDTATRVADMVSLSF
jgi:hypothetical protein